MYLHFFFSKEVFQVHLKRMKSIQKPGKNSEFWCPLLGDYNSGRLLGTESALGSLFCSHQQFVKLIRDCKQHIC